MVVGTVLWVAVSYTSKLRAIAPVLSSTRWMRSPCREVSANILCASTESVEMATRLQSISTRASATPLSSATATGVKSPYMGQVGERASPRRRP